MILPRCASWVVARKEERRSGVAGEMTTELSWGSRDVRLAISAPTERVGEEVGIFQWPNRRWDGRSTR